MREPVTSGGEPQRGRLVMDRLTERAIRAGIPAERARELARDALRQADRQRRR